MASGASKASDAHGAVIRVMTEAIDRHDLAALAVHPGLSAFPDHEHTVEEQAISGNIVTTRAVIHGTHRGPLMGAAPTGTRIEAMVLMMDGKIVLHYALPDWLAILMPIGAIPALRAGD